MELITTLQHEMVSVQSDTELHLLLELRAPIVAPDADRRPLRLALALDRSGSMGGGKLEAAKDAARFLVDNLHDDDRLAIVTYDSSVDLLAPMAPLDRTRLRALIDGIHPGGSTNLSGGLLKAGEEAGRPEDDDTAVIRRVLLLSDGHANVGILDAGQLASIADTWAAQGISTSTIGFGHGFDEELMTGIADAGRGGAHYAEGTDELPEIFAQEFDDLLSLAAQNVSVELRPTSEVQVVSVLNDYPSLPVPGGVQVQVGDAFAGQTIRVVAKLNVPALPGLGLADIGEVVLRWVSVSGEQVASHQVTTPIVVNAVSAEDAAKATPNKAVVDEVTVLLAGQKAAEARRLADEGRVDEARDLALEAAKELRAVDPDHPAAAALRRTAQTLERTSDMMLGGAYGVAESKAMHYEARKVRRHKRGDRE